MQMTQQPKLSILDCLRVQEHAINAILPDLNVISQAHFPKDEMGSLLPACLATLHTQSNHGKVQVMIGFAISLTRTIARQAIDSMYYDICSR